MPDYFRSIGISLKAGRTLNESDTATAEKAVVVNEAFVKDYLADVMFWRSYFPVSAPGLSLPEMIFSNGK
jgi:hypothetical protein